MREDIPDQATIFQAISTVGCSRGEVSLFIAEEIIVSINMVPLLVAEKVVDLGYLHLVRRSNLDTL
jgi:hypothetical protein